MWVKSAAFIELNSRCAAQGATVEWLRIRVNQLERENAILKNQKFHLPVDVAQIERAEAPVATPSTASREPEPPSMEDLVHGNVSRGDMGDDEARRLGVGWDADTGKVVYGR